MLRQYDTDATYTLDPRQKFNHRFAHPLTGQLLCPAKLNFEDEEYVSHTIPGSHSLNPGLHRLCQVLNSSEYDLQATDWPTFFYKDYKYDSENKLEGLLKGEILV